LKISLFYGDIKFSEFEQFEAYDVKTLLGAYTLLYSPSIKVFSCYTH